MSTAVKPSKVSMRNIKAIRELEFDIPETGGVVVFTGSNGAGKTTAILALEGLINGAKVDLAPSDGAESGEVQGLGRKLSVKQRVTKTGRTLVPTLGSRLNISDLVDPQFTDPKVRTKARTRALVGLSGRAVKPEELLEEWIAEHVDFDAAREIEDPIQLADFLKRGVDRSALEAEKEAELAAKLSEAKRLEVGDVDELDSAESLEVLANKNRAAVAAVAAAEKLRDDHAQALASNAEIERRLAELPEWDGPAEGDIAERLETWDAEVKRLQAELTVAMSHLSRAKKEKAALDLHAEKVRLVAAGMVDLEALPKPPSDSDLAKLKEAEQAAYAKMLAVQSIEDRKRKLAEAKSQNAKAIELQARADQLRAAGKGIQDKVQSLLPSGKIVLHEGELCVMHDRRKKLVPYDDLSEGERWWIALEYAIAVVGEGGLIAIKQEAWQSLSPEARDVVVRFAVEHRVTIATAQVAQGELRTEVYG